MNKIIIINTGNGNFLSVKRAVELFYKNVEISDKADEIKSASKIIFLGFGEFKDSVNILKKKKIFDTIKEVSKDTPLLGICLGWLLKFQILDGTA
jgi:imidazole glycerol-phosphate synthase subunit HisH